MSLASQMAASPVDMVDFQGVPNSLFLYGLIC